MRLDTDNQRVIIQVKDINDEAPYFINRPLPMQAVVQLNAPPNTPVFTLQARDPDTDHNIHYFLVRDRSMLDLNVISCQQWALIELSFSDAFICANYSWWTI